MKLILMINRFVVLFAIAVIGFSCCQAAHAQLRVVTHNTLVKPTTAAEQTLARTIYGAIAGRSANGIAKRPDLIGLQEQQTGVFATSDQMITALEAEFGVTTYEKVLLSLGTVKQSYVYDSSVLTPIGSSEVSLGIRPGLRTEWQLVGYDENSRFLTYCVHLKAGSSTSDLFLRNVEATNLRTDADSFDEGTPIIYMGDFNIGGHTEDSYLTLTDVGSGSGNGQAFDPIQLTSWPGLASRQYLSQSTRTTSLPDGGAFGGIDDRFDSQLVTDELMDGEGISYMGPSSSGFGGEHSYVAFGNDGQVYNVAINSFYAGREQPADVLDALHDFSDHLPVVADYQLPAKMEVTVDFVPAAIIVGASVSVDFDVANTAPVALEVAADELDYVFITSGDLMGAGGGTDPATGDGQTESFDLDASTVGGKSGTLTVDGLSQQTSDPESISNVNFDVFDQSNPSFSNLKDEDSLLIDLGDVALGSPAEANFSIYNLVSAFGAELTADLDLDSITEKDVDDKFSVSGPLFDNLAAGQQELFTLEVVADQPGMFMATFDFNLSDQNLPGESTHSLSLVAVVNVIADTILGDMNGDGAFDNLDISPFVLALTDPKSFAAQYPDVNPIVVGDMNGDGVFDNLDISDFVGALTGGG